MILAMSVVLGARKYRVTRLKNKTCENADEWIEKQASSILGMIRSGTVNECSSRDERYWGAWF